MTSMPQPVPSAPQAEFSALFPDGEVCSLIGGEHVVGSGERVVVINPATEDPSHGYADGGAAHGEQALEAARQGGLAWRAKTASARGAILFRTSELVRRDVERLAVLESHFAGKPIRDARVEVGKVADMFAYYAGWADKIHGDVIPVPTSHVTYTLREPLGTIVQITPWNAPIFTAGWQLAPALAAGNAVILKPSELTPVSSIALGHLLIEAGVPAEAVSVVAGLGATAGARLVSESSVGKTVFIGSTETGRKIAAAAGAVGRPALLELGGKSANIVFADADLARAAKAAQGAIFGACGQSCTAGSRLLVQRNVHDQLVEKLVSGTNRLTVGAPLDDVTEIGPINNRPQYDKVCGMIADGREAGAEIVAGGMRPDDLDAGYYLRPTVLAGATNDLAIAREEIFGPVLTVIPFADEDEAIAIANDTEFDLAGAVWTREVGRAHRVARALRAGTVWVNGYRTLSVMAPFGGQRGSGFGRSSGSDVMMEYTQAKSVWVETDDAAPIPFGYGVDD
ncbi:MAG: aldehyde dehydrogenase family protein [Pseudomonadota bacterium]